jgi:hypothetical protein
MSPFAQIADYVRREGDIFYPQDVDEAAKSFLRNPLTMDRPEKQYTRPVDYKSILTAFLLEHDPEQAMEAEEILNKCVGKEAILFSVFAAQYDTSNALNAGCQRSSWYCHAFRCTSFSRLN